MAALSRKDAVAKFPSLDALPHEPKQANSALGRDDFGCLAANGFGSGWNHYSHTMAWFQDRLYVGTSRAILAMVKVNDPAPQFTFWPIDSPDDVYELDRRAHIWRLDPRNGEWDQVYHSPIVEGHTGEQVARDIGYRGSVVHQVPGESQEALYVCTWSSSRGQPPLILRTFDGDEFEELPRPVWGDSVNTFRALTSFKGKLYTAPTGSTAGYGKAQECVAGSAVVYECSQPESGEWIETCEPGFGDPGNVTVFELAIFDDHLYAGTINPDRGYQIWKTQAEGTPPYEWTLVVTDGAHRGNENEIAVCLCPLGDALYIGSGIINGGYDRRREIGPAPAEIIRVFPDDSWDLLMGNARVTPDGLKTPLSAHTAGFGNFCNGYMWRMATHRGYLYVGSFKWTALMPYMPLDKWPGILQLEVEGRGVDNIVNESGGFDLWRTRDGIHWDPVTQTGFENPYNWGVRTMQSTDYGLFLGTANPFGPDVARRTKSGEWRYDFNERGATEIWLGHRVEDDDDATHD